MHNKKISWIIVFLVLVSSATAVELDKKEYVLGDVVKITLEKNHELSILSLSTNEVYSFLGEVNGEIRFNPKYPGEYLLNVYDNNIPTEAIRFKVNEKPAHITEDIIKEIDVGETGKINSISLKKNNYFIGELVLIKLDLIPNSSVFISNEKDVYNFFGEIDKEIKFIPRDSGEYNVFVKDFFGNIIDKKTFNVMGKETSSGIKEIIQSSISPSELDDEEIILVEDQLYDKTTKLKLDKLKIQNSKKSDLSFDYKFMNKVSNKTYKKGQDLFAGSYDVEISPKTIDIKKIKIYNLNYSGEFDLGLGDVSKTQKISQRKSIKSFAIDPSNLEFESGSMTTTAEGTELWKCKDWDFDTETCYGDWKKIKSLVPGQEYEIYITPEDPGFTETLTILNVQSYPVVGDEWKVAFQTLGKNNLTITAIKDTTWNNVRDEKDLQFLNVKCGQQILNYAWVNNSVYISDFECNETSYETSKVLTQGIHDLEFDFGGYKAYAHNFAYQDFYVQRGTTVVSSASASATITEGIHYDLYPGATTENTFIRITNTRLTGMGDTTGGGTQNVDDYTFRIDNPENVLTSITFTRVGLVNPQRVSWEIIQYIGPSGGPNEFKVRGTGDISTTGTTASGNVLSNIEDNNKVAVFITGQASSYTASSYWQRAMFTSNLIASGSDWQPQFTRGVATDTGYVSYAVVEFTGSNWRDVQRVEFTSSQHGASTWSTGSPDVSGTYSIPSSLLNSSRAFLHNQYRIENTGVIGLDDAGENIELTADSNTLFTTRRKVNSLATDKYHVIWIIENTQTGDGEMQVEHVAYYDGDVSSPEEKVYTRAITTVDSLNSTSIMGEACSSDGGGTAYPRGSANVRLTAIDEVSWTVSDSGQEERRSFDVVQWPTYPRIGPNISLNYPGDTDSVTNYDFQFNFTATDDSGEIQNCTFYINDTGVFEAKQSFYDVVSGSPYYIDYDPGDGSFEWNIECYDNYGYGGFYSFNYTFTLDTIPQITINDVEEDTATRYDFNDQNPSVNATISRNSTCYLSEFDESYADMVSNGRVNCGLYVKNVSKECVYTNSLTAGYGDDYLYMSCESIYGNSNSDTDNADMYIRVECDAHSDCTANNYCSEISKQCDDDEFTGYSCESVGIGGIPDDDVCRSGRTSTNPTALCINDSSYSYTGWYCSYDDDDCVYDNGGNSYDLNYILCTGNDYRQCSVSNDWSSLIDCGDLNDPDDQSATASTHPGGYCAYFTSPQTCTNGDTDSGSFGCSGGSTDCGNYIYSGGGVCGSGLSACDAGCGAECDTDNSTAAAIEGDYCYYDKSCSAICAWSSSNEYAPLFCINDNDGGLCSYENRTDPSIVDICYYTQTCADTVGSGLSSSGMMSQDYCDYCSDSGVVSGDYSPPPNTSCSSDCFNTGIIYYDTNLTPLDRSDDCSFGSTSIQSDSLSIGDIWTGSDAAYCDDTECDLDCGTLTGVCSLGVCICSDTDKPEIRQIWPYEDYWNNDVIFFYYNATDYGSGIENCSLLIDDSITNTTTNIIEGDTLNFSRSFSDGSYQWSIGCYDDSAVNNYNITENRDFGVDTVDPSISNPNKVSNITFKISDTICLNVSASDALSGIDRVYGEVKLPSGSITEVDFSDSSTTICDQINGDGIFSVEYLIRYSGVFNWTTAYVVDRASNSNSVSAGFFWNVTEGGNLFVNMTEPLADIEINESTGIYTQTCNATCDWGFVDCNAVKLKARYYDGDSWTQITTSSENLYSDVNEYTCGDLSAYQAPWWNSTFNYRQQIRVNALDAVAADHIIRIDYDTSGSKFRDDAKDLRLVYWNGTDNNEVDRQVFQPNSTGSSIWFVVGEALAANTSNYNYYMYYGNPSSTQPKNNESNIWLFYDDFSDGTYLDKWGYVPATGQVGITSTTNPWSGTNYVLDVGTACGTTYTKVLTSELSPIRDMASRILWMDNPGTVCGGGSPDADGVVGLHGSATTGYDGILVERDTDTGFHYDTGATGGLYGSAYYSPFNTWQWSEVRAYGTTASNYKAKYWLYTEAEPTTYPLVAATVSATSAGQPFIRVASGRAHIAVIMVRPTVEFEPTTEIKAEETYGQGHNTSCNYTFTITAKDSGNNNFSIQCQAISENSEFGYSHNLTLTVNDHPTAEFYWPTDITWLNSIVDLNASSSYDLDGNLVNYEFMIDDNQVFSSPSQLCSSSDPNCSFDTSLQTQCVEDALSCYLQVNVTDNDGLTDVKNITIGIDNNGPDVVLGNPLNFTNISALSYIVDATATDSGIGIDSVYFEYRENDSTTWILINTDDRSPYQTTWDTSIIPEGNYYEVRAYANDTLGNIGNYNSHTNITIDRTGPQISLGDPGNESYTSDIDIVFYYNATDLYSDIRNCSIYINDVLNTTNSSILFNNNISVSDLDEGTYEWYVRCYDTLGNYNTSATKILYIDTSGPITTLDIPKTLSSLTGSSVIVNASVISIGAFEDTTIFEYRYNNEDTWTYACSDDRITAGIASCTWTLSDKPDGNSYEFQARTNDTLSNWGDNNTHTNITIDNNGPAIALITPEDELIDGDGNVQFGFSVNDFASGIFNCSIIINGELNQTIDTGIIEDEIHLFNLTNMSNGDYYWNITCFDDYAEKHSNTSETWLLTIDIKYIMNVEVTTDRLQYEKGNQGTENVMILTNTTGFYNNSLPDVNIYNDIVKLINTSENMPYWWNTSWERRLPLYIYSNSSHDREDTIILASITGLSGYIDDCENEIRLADINGTEIPVSITGGDDSTYCDIVFNGDVSGQTTENKYFVYYNNSGAVSPSYSVLSIESTQISYTGFEADHTTSPYDGWVDGGTSCIPQQNVQDWCDDSGVCDGSGEWSIEIQDDQTNSELYQSFDLSSPCDGESCTELNLSFWVRPNSYDKLDEGWDVYCDHNDADEVNIVHWAEDLANSGCDDINGVTICEDTWTYLTIDLVEAGCTIDSSVEIKFTGEDSVVGLGTADQIYIDGPNLTGYNYGGINLTTYTGSTQQWIQRTQGISNISGLYEYTLLVSTIDPSNYSTISLGEKTLYLSEDGYSVFEFINDHTPPNITLNTPENNTGSNSSVTFTYFVNDTLSSIRNCSLFIDGNFEDLDDTIQEDIVQYFFPRIPSGGPHEWYVACTDYYNNTGYSENWTIIITPPDLYVNNSLFFISNTTPKEGQNVSLNATIFNIGGSDAINITAQFYQGNPVSGGVQIGEDILFNLTDIAGEFYNTTINMTWIVPGPGPFILYVQVDPPLATNGTIDEMNETNNLANLSLSVPGWSYYYGNSSGIVSLQNLDEDKKYFWNITDGGNIYVVETGTEIDWVNLYALGRDINDIEQQDDFTELDDQLNMTLYVDSVNNTYTKNNLPVLTNSVVSYSRTLLNVPFVNSTNTSNFLTGILWDSSDLARDDYNGSQDIIFITKANVKKQGKYGIYDYEIRIPAALDNYRLDTGSITFYTEIP